MRHFPLFGPVACPKCVNGMLDGRHCPVCLGSGSVWLTPAAHRDCRINQQLPELDTSEVTDLVDWEILQ